MAKSKNKVDKEQILEYIFILDEETKGFIQQEENNKIIFSENELSKIIEYKEGLKAVVILAELEWQGKYLQYFYGFDIAVELRKKHKLICPIIITSTLSLSYFVGLAKNRNDIKYKLLFGRGTGFLLFSELESQLEQTVEAISKFPISNAVLADMNEMLLNQKGFIIDMLTHELQFVKVGNNLQKLENTLNETAAYLTKMQLDELNWVDFQKQLSDNISDAGKFNTAADKLIKECERILVSDTNPPEVKSDKKHKILVIEDDPNFRKKIEENLKEHFEELITTGNAEEAIQKISADGTNKIIGIIADWRLYKDQTEYWQLQGYEVLDYAAKNHFTALFALTSLSDYNVHNIRNSLGLDIHLFKKQYLDIPDSWKMLADTVKQKCDAILEVIASDKNMGEGWTKSEEKNKKGEITASFTSLRDQYLEKRAREWAIFEKQVSDRADILWNYYKNSLDPVKDRSLEDFGKKFGIQFEKSGFPLLESVLIIRRIWLALWYSNTLLDLNVNGKEPAELKVLCVLRNTFFDNLAKSEHLTEAKSKAKSRSTKKFNGKETEKSIEEDIEDKLIQNSKNLLNKLCVIPSTLPLGILPEEKNWLLKKEICIDEGNDLFDRKARNEILDAEENEFDPSTPEGQTRLNELGNTFPSSVDDYE